MVLVGLQGGHTWGQQQEGMCGSGLVDTELAEPVITALRHKSTEVNRFRKSCGLRKYLVGNGGGLPLKKSKKLLEGKSWLNFSRKDEQT